MITRLFALPVITILIAFVWVEEMKSPEKTEEFSYPEHLTGAFTGGFGEETCRSCHFDYDLNPEDGKLVVKGLETSIAPGKTKEISIQVSRKELGKAGFQLAARFSDGSQAGTFLLDDNKRLTITPSVSDTVQYIQHSAAGTEPVEDGANRWMVRWQAPDAISMPVIFNITANASNGDQSEFGDFIYAEEIRK